MGFTKLLVLFVAAAISTVAGREDKDGPVIGTHQSPFPEPQKTTVTVDWLFSTGYGISESVSVAEAVPKTTICSQQCSVVTLSTVIRPADSSQNAAPVPPVASISCVTIQDATSEMPAPTTTVSPSQSLTTSLSLKTLTTTTTICPAKPKSISLWSWSRPATSVETHVSVETGNSVEVVIPEVTATAVDSSTYVEVIIPAETLSSVVVDDDTEPCTTEITVTMTKTFTQTWQSKQEVTTTLVRTRSITVETVVFETYSTMTDEITVDGVSTATTTLQTVSLDTDCAEVGKCCVACSATAVDVSTGEIEESPSASLIEGSSLIVNPASSGDVIVSASLVPEPSPSPSDAPFTTGSAASSTEEVATSVQTAGAARATAAMGVGVVVGLLGLLA